jgi:hypothetical protein
MMRAFIRSLIVDDPTLQALNVTPAGVFMGDADTPQERPFVQLRWGGTTPGVGAVDRRSLVVWVHDNPGDYTRVDAVLTRIKALFKGVAAAPHSSGWISQLDWVNDSDDLTDDGHGTITRNTTHTLIGSGN